MKLKQLTDNVLETMYQWGYPVVLMGPSGMGKTERLQQFGNHMEKKYDGDFAMVDNFDVSAMDAPDIMGFNVPTKNAAGEAVSRYTVPALVEAIRDTGASKGILFLDELKQGDQLVLKALAQTFSARRIGQHKLPDGWVVWGASNPPQTRAGTSKWPGHMPSRMRILDITPDLDGWVAWATANDVNPMYIAAVSRMPDMVFSGEEPKDPEAPRCNARSIVRAASYHNLTATNGGMSLTSDSLTQELIAGDIGEGAAVKLFAFFKVASELPELDDILTNPARAKLPDETRLDAQHAAMQMCVYNTSPDTAEPLVQYITRLRKELQVSAVQQMLKKGAGAMLNSPTLAKFIRENPALIQATLSD